MRGLNLNSTVSSKKEQKKNFNTPSSRQRLLSLHGPLLPDLRCQACNHTLLVPVFRGKITEPPICPHNACSSPLSTTSPTLPTARSKRRQTRSQPLDNLREAFWWCSWHKCASSASKARNRLAAVVVPTWPFSSSANTYISTLCCLTYALPVHILFYQPSTRASFYTQTCSPLCLRLYHEHYVYSPIHFSGASTFPCARPVWSQTTISRVTQRQTVTVNNDFAHFGHRVGPGWARHVTFGNG